MMKKNLKSNFIRSVIVMVTGTVAAQVIKMLFSPIITRLYDPAAIGNMGVFASVVQIIIPISAFTFPMAIVLPRSDKNAKGLMKLSIYISLTITLLISILLLLFSENLISLFNIEKISSYIFLIPMVIMFSTFMQVFEQWFIRIKQFSINAKSMVYQAVIVEGSKVGIGLFYPTAPVLIVLTALNNGVRALFLILFGKKQVINSQKDFKEDDLSLKQLFKKYKDFPFLRAPQMFIDATSKSLPILLLTSLFGAASAGFFTICNTVLRMPTSLIGSAVGNVFYPKINEAALKGQKLKGLIKKATFSLGFVGIIPFALIIIFGPLLFELVFGSNWTVAGEYARWLALSSFMRFMNEPCIRVLPVLSAQSLHLIITIIQTCIRVLMLVLGFFIFKNDQIAIALYGLTGALINGLLIFITFKITKKFDESKLKHVRK